MQGHFFARQIEPGELHWRTLLHEPDDDDPAASGDEPDRLLHDARDPGRLDDDRHAFAVRQSTYLVGDAIRRQRRSRQARAPFQVFGLDVRDEDFGSVGARHFHDRQSDGARAEDEHPVARGDLTAPASLDPDRYRLGEGGLEIGHARGDAVQVGGRRPNGLREAAVRDALR